MSKAREFWVEKFNGHQPPSYKVQLEKPEKINMCKVKIGDADPIASLEYFHVIEYNAYERAKEISRNLEHNLAKLRKALEKFTEKHGPDIVDADYEDEVEYGRKALKETGGDDG